MRCLYDVLNVTNDADDTQLKKAYRQAALQWHPDKNQERQQEAEVRFKEIQNAYEILSDKHERAWYDSHRAQILRADGNYQAGGGGFSSDEAAPPEDLSLYQYFSSSCYNSYNDDPKGFYTVYREVFEGLSKHESEAAERAGKKGPSPASFGLSDSPWSEVSAFYRYWLQFVSDREFGWADVHNLASAPNRKVRRLMEEDNKKRRRGARREFQENVRSLVEFVRKRDRRVAAWQQQEELNKQQRLAAEAQRKEEERLQRIQRAREYEDAAWVDAGATDEDSHDEELVLAQDELYCVACDKFFKSANALANHERSKKHLERAEALRDAMQEEEDALSPIAESDAENEVSSAEGSSPTDDLGPSSEEDDTAQPSGRLNADREAREKAHVNGFDTGQQHSSNGGVGSLEPILADLDASGQRSPQESDASEEAESIGSESASEAESEASEESLDEDAMLARMVQAHAKISKPRASTRRRSHAKANGDADHREAVSMQPEPDRNIRGDAEEAPTDAANLTAASMQPGSVKDSTGDADEAATTSTHSAKAEPELGACSSAQADSIETADAPVKEQSDNGKSSKKPKSRRDKRKAKEAAANEKGLLCSVCRAHFETRNQLFKHIAERGHAQLK